jgi:outer membrane protein
MGRDKAKFTMNERKGDRMQSASKWMMLTVLAILVFAPTAFCADVAKIGVVEFQRLFDNSVGGKEIKAQITAKGKKMEAELKAKSDEIEELKKRLEREALVMSKDMREEKEREFRIKVNDIKMLKKKYEAELQTIQKKLMGGLQKETLEIIDEIGKSEGYLLIMDKRGVLYSPGTIDITDTVIKKYDAKYKKDKKKQ